MSLANLRRPFRTALLKDLVWVTPHSFRRTVATVVRNAHGPALAQQQLSHAKLATTEAHYLQRQTHGPDVRITLDRFAAGKISGKYQVDRIPGSPAKRLSSVSAGTWSRLGESNPRPIHYE